MGLEVQSEEIVSKKLTDYAKSGLFHIGLVIAQIYEEKAFVIHLAPLPSSVGSEEVALSEDVVVTKQPTHSGHPDSLASVKEGSVATHARQVVRMLQGGLDVCGIYVTVPSSLLNNSLNQGKIRSILTAVHKATSKFFLGTGESSLDKVVLFGCTETARIGAKSMDLSEHGTTLVSETFKTQGTKFIPIAYSYHLSYSVHLPADKSSQSLCNSVLTPFKTWARAIEKSVIIIDKKILKDDSSLDPTVTDENPLKRKHGGRNSPDFETRELKAEFLEGCNPVNGKSEMQDTSGYIKFVGTLVGKAYLHRNAKAGDAFVALKRDLIRSFVSRWGMHCDSLVEEPLGTTLDPVLHEPPRRVFLVEVDGLPVSLCDYLFPGDSVHDACHSAKELLDICVNEDNVQDHLENWADPVNLQSTVTDSLSSPPTGATYLQIRRSGTLFLIFAIVVGFIAVGISYFVITRSKPIS